MPYQKDGKWYCDFCHGPEHLYPCWAMEKAMERAIKEGKIPRCQSQST